MTCQRGHEKGFHSKMSWLMSVGQDTMEVKGDCFSLKVWDQEYDDSLSQNNLTNELINYNTPSLNTGGRHSPGVWQVRGEWRKCTVHSCTQLYTTPLEGAGEGSVGLPQGLKTWAQAQCWKEESSSDLLISMGVPGSWCAHVCTHTQM